MSYIDSSRPDTDQSAKRNLSGSSETGEPIKRANLNLTPREEGHSTFAVLQTYAELVLKPLDVCGDDEEVTDEEFTDKEDD